MLLRHLRSFCVVAEEGHVTRAARRLNMAQPGLTQQMKALEEAVGVELIQRCGRGIELTQSGRFLHAEAEGLLDHVHAVLERTRTFAGVCKSRIEVGITGFVSLEPGVTNRLQEFRQLHPDMKVRDIVLESEHAFKLLRQKRLDIVFSCGTLPDDGATIKRVLGPISTALAVSCRHRLATQEHTSLRELSKESLTVVSPCPGTAAVKERIRRMYAKQALLPQEFDVTADIFSALSRVSSNSCVAIVPSSIQTLKTEAVRYLLLTEPLRPIPTLALYVRKGEQNPHVCAFTEMP